MLCIICTLQSELFPGIGSYVQLDNKWRDIFILMRQRMLPKFQGVPF